MKFLPLKLKSYIIFKIKFRKKFLTPCLTHFYFFRRFISNSKNTSQMTRDWKKISHLIFGKNVQTFWTSWFKFSSCKVTNEKKHSRIIILRPQTRKGQIRLFWIAHTLLLFSDSTCALWKIAAGNAVKSERKLLSKIISWAAKKYERPKMRKKCLKF